MHRLFNMAAGVVRSLCSGIRNAWNNLTGRAAFYSPIEIAENHTYQGPPVEEGWSRYTDLALEDAIAILTRDLPEETQVRLRINADGSGWLSMEAPGQFSDARRFDLSYGETYAGSMTVEKTGNKLGRILFRNEIEFFHAVGIKRVNIHAGWLSGGYTWARFGFLPDFDDNEDFDALTRKEIKRRFKALKPIIPEREYRRLAKAVQLKDPMDMWRIADRRTNMGARLRTVFSEAANDAGKKIRGDLKRAFNHSSDIDEYTSEQLELLLKMANEKRPVPLGRVLLAGTDWEGYLDLEDPRQMARAGRYVGGWQSPDLAAFGPKKPGL